MHRVPIRMSIACGCVWGVIGLAVGYVASQPSMTLRSAVVVFSGGLLASPIIGVLMGLISRRFQRLPVLLRIIVAGASLYGAALLFVVAYGLMWALRLGRFPQDFWFNSVAMTWAGLAWTWSFVLLWPLAYLTHALVSRAWDREITSLHGTAR